MNESPLERARERATTLSSSVRFGQFVSAGIVGAAADNLSLYLLVEFGGLGPIPAKVVAWELAIVVIFTINERWTFATYGATGVGALGRRFLRSNVVRFGGFLVTLTVLAALVYGFDVWYVGANVVGIGVGFVVNYVCESLYTWKVHQDDW